MEFLIGLNFNLLVGNITLKICQINAQIISQLIKSIYSCKNVVYKGRRRVFLSKTLSTPKGEEALVPDDVGSKKVTSFEIENIRVIMYDSSWMEREIKATTYHLSSNEDQIIQEDDRDEMPDDMEH